MLKPKSSPHLFSRPHILQKGLPYPTNQQELLTNSLLYLLKLCNSVKCLQQIHTQMLINSIQKHNFLLSKMVHLRDLPYAFLLFSQIPEPNDFSFNVMIRGLTNTWRKFALALEFYHRMKYSGQKPNNFTYPFVLISCANISSLNEGRAAHSSIFKTGLDSNIHVSNSLITMYSRCGELGCARWLFDEITEKDLVSWNSMISGYTQMGFASEAVGLFRRMMMRGEASEPDEVTLVSILGACASLGDLSLGRWVESLVEEKNLEKSSFLGSALIDMYGKCGVLKSARKVFDGMSKKDVVVWNAMITGQVLCSYLADTNYNASFYNHLRMTFTDD